MFDFNFSELLLIGAVAVVLIGPKDMPVAIRAVARFVKKARRMAGEFQSHVDDMLREADMGDMRQHIAELRSLNVRAAMARAVDPDGALRDAVAEPSMVPERPAHTIFNPHAFAAPPAAPYPDVSVPPHFVPPARVAAARAALAAPSFVPPGRGGVA